MKPTIIYKLDFDFIGYCHTCANVHDMRKMSNQEMKQHPAISSKDLKKSYDEYYDEAEIYYNEKLSYIQKSELDMFFKKVSMFMDYLMSITIHNKSLEEENLEDFQAFVLKVLELEEKDLKIEKLHKAIKDHYDQPHFFNDYSKEAQMIFETLKDERLFNSIFKNAIASLREAFIEHKYKPSEAYFENKLADHNEKYSNNPIEFMINISTGMLKEEDLLKVDYQPYITFFSPYNLMISMKNDGFIIYSDKLEQLNKEDFEKDLMQSFLKFLSDPKRYEMIQMLSKEKWYANELAKKFKITPATMSYHVNKLYGLGLITFEQGEQNKLYIELDKKRLRDLLNLITNDLTI
ncbi:MAG: winged helix-turn-helix transcriptional regulator [Clostridia bacterium]|nr:winged helix-turn-helix transcriptional regulator [Clostridia bacterium]